MFPPITCFIYSSCEDTSACLESNIVSIPLVTYFFNNSIYIQFELYSYHYTFSVFWHKKATKLHLCCLPVNRITHTWWLTQKPLKNAVWLVTDEDVCLSVMWWLDWGLAALHPFMFLALWGPVLSHHCQCSLWPVFVFSLIWVSELVYMTYAMYAGRHYSS